MKDFVINVPDEKEVDQEMETPMEKTRFPWLVRFVFPVGVIFLLGIIGYQLPPYFRSVPQTLIIKGNKNLSEKTIVDYLHIPKGKSWLQLDPYQLSVNLKRHPWIDQAIVHRSFPLTLTATIVERVPIAFLRTADDMVLLGKDYLVLKDIPTQKKWDLPIIVNTRLQRLEDGDVVQRSHLGKAFQLIEILRDHPVLNLDAVSEIIVTDPYNIELITIPHGIKIKFGFDKFEKKLASLYRTLPGLTDFKDNIRYIDLRYVRGVVIRQKR